MALLFRGLAQAGLFLVGFFTGGGLSGLSRLVMWGGFAVIALFLYKNLMKG